MDIITVLDNREDLVAPVLINYDSIIRFKANGDVIYHDSNKFVPMSKKVLEADYLLIKELHKAHISDFLQKGYMLTVFVPGILTKVKRVSFKNNRYYVQSASFKKDIDWSKHPITEYWTIKEEVVYGVWTTMVEQEM